MTFINIFQALVKITWRQKRRGKKFQAGKRTPHLFPKQHKTLKRSRREDGKALEKVAADRLVAESLENSRTNRCVNLMGMVFFLFFLLMFFLPYELKFKMNVCFLKFFSFTFVKTEQHFRPRALE